MKILLYIVLSFLAVLVVFQNVGGRYGSYSVLSYLWLLLALQPIFIELKTRKEIKMFHILYLLILVFVILIQPTISIHPIYVLSISLVIVIPFLVFVLRGKANILEGNEYKIDNEVKQRCKKLIAENKIDYCFELLLSEIKDKQVEHKLLVLKQKWNKNKSEKNLNLNTNEWLEVQSSKIVHELLSIVN